MTTENLIPEQLIALRKEQKLAYAKDHYLKNKERIKAYAKARYALIRKSTKEPKSVETRAALRKEQRKAYQQQYYLSNKEKLQEYKKAYYESTKDMKTV